MLLGIKRIYDKSSLTDGKRVLIDALWPRGVRRGTANIDKWIKKIAPSRNLRIWFNHDPTKWEQFREKYKKELKTNSEVGGLVELAKSEDITLVYATKDEHHNNAIVLVEVLKERLKGK